MVGETESDDAERHVLPTMTLKKQTALFWLDPMFDPLGSEPRFTKLRQEKQP